MKKILAAVLALVMILACCACGGNNNAGNETGDKTLAGTYDITVWVADKIVDLTKAEIAKFNAENKDGIVFNATVNPVSESDAATNMITDVAAGGDIYCFAQDQFARLVQAGALAKLGTAAAEEVKNGHSEGAVKAATSGDVLYAYPLSDDNGYFMYYDKSVIPEADVDSLEKLIADCEAANKYFAFELQTSAWYLASFFFATGCVSEWKMDNDGKFESVNDTFNSEKGLIAAKGMKKLVSSPIHLSSSKGTEFASGAAVVVTGIWDYETVKGILGDNMGVTDLPSFEVDGTSYHLGSYNGFKLLGVKPQSDAVKQAAIHKLAQYLTGYECNMDRFNEQAWGPSNKEAQSDEKVKVNIGLSALRAQYPYSVPQGQIHGSWWDIAKVIGDDVKAATDDAGLKSALESYETKIKALFNMSSEEQNGWGVIGMFNATDGFFFTDYGEGAPSNWTDEAPMEDTGNGVWKTKTAYSIPEGCEFKVRQGHSWDNAFPADNYKVEAAGTYFIQFDSATGEITLIAE